jgi:hypothetical protein
LQTRRSLDTVPEDLIEKFRTGAEDVLKSKDAVSAIAAALAVISGCTKVTQRSLLSSKEVRPTTRSWVYFFGSDNLLMFFS